MVSAHKCHSPIQTINSEHSSLICDDIVRRCITFGETIFNEVVDDAHTPRIQGVRIGNIR